MNNIPQTVRTTPVPVAAEDTTAHAASQRLAHHQLRHFLKNSLKASKCITEMDFDVAPRHLGDKFVANTAFQVSVLTARERLVFSIIHAAGPTGATAEEIALQLGWPPHKVTPVTDELNAAVFIADSGWRRPNRLQEWIVVWAVARE